VQGTAYVHRASNIYDTLPSPPFYKASEDIFTLFPNAVIPLPTLQSLSKIEIPLDVHTAVT
jgi:hypothetical protein